MIPLDKISRDCRISRTSTRACGIVIGAMGLTTRHSELAAPRRFKHFTVFDPSQPGCGLFHAPRMVAQERAEAKDGEA
jgi:hypothetical protein